MLCCRHRYPPMILSEWAVEKDVVDERGRARSALLVLSFESSDSTAMLLQNGGFCFGVALCSWRYLSSLLA